MLKRCEDASLPEVAAARSRLLALAEGLDYRALPWPLQALTVFFPAAYLLQ